MGRAQRQKGGRGQREAVALLRDCGWHDAHTEGGVQRHSTWAADVDAEGLRWRVEVKVGATLDLPAAIRQAQRDAEREARGRPWMVLARIVSTKGPRDDPAKRWMAITDCSEVVRHPWGSLCTITHAGERLCLVPRWRVHVRFVARAEPDMTPVVLARAGDLDVAVFDAEYLLLATAAGRGR